MSKVTTIKYHPSCPAESAKRVFALERRASTSFLSTKQDVDGRDKPGHDENLLDADT